MRELHPVPAIISLPRFSLHTTTVDQNAATTTVTDDMTTAERFHRVPSKKLLFVIYSDDSLHTTTVGLSAASTTATDASMIAIAATTTSAMMTDDSNSNNDQCMTIQFPIHSVSHPSAWQ